LTTDVSQAEAQLKSINNDLADYFRAVANSLKSGVSPPLIQDVVAGFDYSELQRRSQQADKRSPDFGAGVAGDTIYHAFAATREFNLAAMSKYDFYTVAEQFYKRDADLFETKAYSHSGVLTGTAPYAYSI
jgi:hypothetical protein